MPLILLLPELAVLAAMTIALLLLFGGDLLKRFMQGLVRGFPLVGGLLGAAIGGLFDNVLSDLRGYFDDAIRGVETVVRILWVPTQVLADAFIRVFIDGANLLHRIVTTDIPTAIAHVLTWTAAQLLSLQAWVSFALAGVIDWAETGFANLLRWVALTEAAIVSWITAELSSVLAWVSFALAGVVTWTTAELAALRSWMVAAVDATTSWVTGELAQLVTWTTASIAAMYDAVFSRLRTEVIQEVGPIWATLEGVSSVALGDLSTTFPDVRDLLGSVPKELPVDLAGVVSALGVMSIAHSVALDRCTIPNCVNLSQFGRDLQGLETLLIDGGLLALLVAAIVEPDQTAQLVFDDLVVPLNGAIDAVASAVGL